MITCQFCGAQNPVGASFCDGCGGALNSAVAAQASAQAQAQAVQATAKQQAVRTSQAAPHFGTGRLPPHTLLNRRYLVLKTVGQGGMAAVYQATDTRANRVVAVKEMSQDGLSLEELREALDGFSAEARLLQSLGHENLPKVYDSFTEDARHYLVMEFIEGQTLEQRMQAARGALPQAEVVRWAAQLCAALDYLHTHKPPIIFRDLKPANIMVTSKGKIKLIDFGIARIFRTNRTRDTQALGTPGYAPPEQYGSAQTDPRADIYALGATLYQLLTAYDVSKTPFALPPLQTRNPAIAPNVRHAIERATRLDRNQRYATIREFQTDLLNPPGLYLLSGALARTPEELLIQMAAQPADGIDALYMGQVADWMSRWKRRDLADAATRAVTAHVDRAAGLHAFLAAPAVGKGHKTSAATSAKWPGSTGAAASGGSPAGGQQAQRNVLGPVVGAVATAVGVGVLAAVTSGAKGRAGGQANGAASPLRTGVNAAVTSFASSLVGTAALPAVSPRELDLGPVSAGRDVSGSLNISALTGVNGVVKALEPWITVSAGQFSGQSTIISVTARATPGLKGVQRGAIQITVPGRSMFIPVIIDIVRPVAPPPPSPAPQYVPSAGAPPARPARSGRAPRPGSLRSVNRFARRGESAIRFVISLTIALALAIGVPLALFHALGRWPETLNLPALLSPAKLMLGLGALAAIGGALVVYLGAWRVSGRARTAALGGLVGVFAAFNIVGLFGAIVNSGWGKSVFPLAYHTHSTQPLAVAIPILVAVGAALGAQSLISRGLIALARFIGSHSVALLIVSAIIGGWLGATLTGAALHVSGGWAAAASACGLILGIGVGLLISQPVGMAARRFATVHP
jgi:serine/threonine protein kinase